MRRVSAPLYWLTPHLTRLVLASLASWPTLVTSLLAELGYSNGKTNESTNESPTTLFTDNQGAMCLANNPVSHSRAKHIDLRHHFVREAIQDKIIWVQYIPTSDMTADSLTKALGREKHEKCTAHMGMS